MKSRHSPFALTVLIFSAAVLLTSPQVARADTEVCANATLDTITLSIDGQGICSQSLNGATAVQAPVFVNTGHCAKYQASGSAFEVVFAPGLSPFYDFKAAAGQTLSIGPAQGTPGETYNYYSLWVGGSQCLNGKSLGLVMR